MRLRYISCERARNICIVKTLAKLGHFPTRKSEKEAWFLSPLRSETQASFNVSLIKNKWYDFGIRKGGNTINLVMLILNCSFQDALLFLSSEKTSFSFSRESFSPEKALSDELKIVQVKDITHPALVEYIKSRAVPLEIARMWCREIYFSLKEKVYFSLGIQNQMGGWELRNKYFKGSSAPKSYTHLKTDSKRVLITEGMFDFLSLAHLDKEMVESSDFIILNSLCFLDKVKTQLSTYDEIQIYLDNDTAGDIATNELISQFDNAKDYRNSYREFKDLNERLQNEIQGKKS